MLQTSTAPRWIQRHSYNHVRDKDIIICYRDSSTMETDIVTITLETKT